MQISQIPSCCGIYLLSGFGGTKSSLEGLSFNLEKTKKDISYWIDYNESRGLMIILNSDQKPIFEEVIKEFGFKLIENFFYTGHGNDIFIYLRKP